MNTTRLTIIRKYEGMKIFVEKPSFEHKKNSLDTDFKDHITRISACDLFSLFTANIIRQDALFIR
ncbi:MAG TPA: hypothetical protein VGP55_00065 [Chitinophagaceae bacterium]|nr:hypothetical protein [Chitinophagaceae bacterium]